RRGILHRGHHDRHGVGGIADRFFKIPPAWRAPPLCWLRRGDRRGRAQRRRTALSPTHLHLLIRFLTHMQSNPNTLDRRQFLKRAGLLAAASMAAPRIWASESVTLPFENGARDLVAYPQKRPLIRLTTRPPQLETPFSVFNESVITPNDAFFVR